MIIEGTRLTPYVSIDRGKIEIKGRSIPEDSFDFYNPVIHAIQEYFRVTEVSTEVHFHLEYINSGSKKIMTNILYLCNAQYLDGKSITIQWYYDFDDESIQELGSDLRKMVQMPFYMHEVNQ